MRLVEIVREHFPHLTIVARARNVNHFYELRRRGVTLIEREIFESALRAGRRTLEELGVHPNEARERALRFRRHNLSLLESLDGQALDEANAPPASGPRGASSNDSSSSIARRSSDSKAATGKPSAAEARCARRGGRPPPGACRERVVRPAASCKRGRGTRSRTSCCSCSTCSRGCSSGTTTELHWQLPLCTPGCSCTRGRTSRSCCCRSDSLTHAPLQFV